MSDTEKKIADTQGQYLEAVSQGQRLTDAEWRNCRIILTTERIALIADSKRQIALADIDRIADRFDINQQSAGVSEYVGLHVGEDVLLVSASDHETFQTDFYRASLDGAVILAQHPALKGGVVQNTEWTKGRLKVTDEALRLAMADGQAVDIDRADIGDLTVDDKQVSGEERTVIQVEHSEDGTSVQTYISGSKRRCSILETLLRKGESRSEIGVDLSEQENEVLMALYSGVSPFEIPDFLGMDVDDVEAVFDRLIELEVVEEIRVRREVALNARGRNIASEAMNDQ